MGQQLYAIAIKTHEGLKFRAPTDEDNLAVDASLRALTAKLPAWEARDLIPTEYRAGGRSDFIESYGFETFRQLFLPRQLFAMATMAETFEEVKAAVLKEAAIEKQKAIITYLAFAFDKALDYNSGQCHWDPTRTKISNTFSLHDFRIRWNPTEFDAARNLFPWAVSQIVDAYLGIAKLVTSETVLKTVTEKHGVTFSNFSALNMPAIESGSIDHINVDPPYYDNVMYGECADFFYVWMKRLIGDLYPDLFKEMVTNKDDEAVANSSRFKEIGGTAKKRTELAARDYENKMTAAFLEIRRVLRDDGVLSIMFTHKQVAAWDALAMSLIGAGFSVHASWPVHTESDNSLHQAKKNAAKSTIILSCRKRLISSEAVWWDDLKNRVRQEARDKAAQFEKDGIRGVDLYIATFGPVLSILSENWPVLTSEVNERTGEPLPLRPELALDLAREEVVQLRKKGLLLGQVVQFDPFTDWYLMAWDAFNAIEFPADEARKLALALGLDLEREIIKEKKLVAKKSSTVVLQEPLARRKRDMVDPDKTSFDCWIDAAHTAMMLYQEDGAQSCKAFLNKAGLLDDGTFKACLQALVNAIPRTKQKGKFLRPEAAALENLCLAFYPEITLPAEEAPPEVEPQGMLPGMGGEEEIEEVEMEEEDEGEED